MISVATNLAYSLVRNCRVLSFIASGLCFFMKDTDGHNVFSKKTPGNNFNDTHSSVHRIKHSLKTFFFDEINVNRMVVLVCMLRFTSNLHGAIIPVSMKLIEEQLDFGHHFGDFVSVLVFLNAFMYGLGAWFSPKYISSRERAFTMVCIMMTTASLLGFFTGYLSNGGHQYPFIAPLMFMASQCLFGFSQGVCNCLDMLYIKNGIEKENERIIVNDDVAVHGSKYTHNQIPDRMATLCNSFNIGSVAVGNIGTYLLILGMGVSWYEVYIFLLVVYGMLFPFVIFYMEKCFNSYFVTKKNHEFLNFDNTTVEQVISPCDDDDEDQYQYDDDDDQYQYDDDDQYQYDDDDDEIHTKNPGFLEILREIMACREYCSYIMSFMFVNCFLQCVLFLGPQILQDVCSFMKPARLLICVGMMTIISGISAQCSFSWVFGSKLCDGLSIPVKDVYGNWEIVRKDYNRPQYESNSKMVNFIGIVSIFFFASSIPTVIFIDVWWLFFPSFFVLIFSFFFISTPYSKLMVEMFPRGMFEKFGDKANDHSNGYIIPMVRFLGDVPAVCLANIIRHHFGSRWALIVMIMCMIMFTLWVCNLVRCTIKPHRKPVRKVFKFFFGLSLLVFPLCLIIFTGLAHFDNNTTQIPELSSDGDQVTVIMIDNLFESLIPKPFQLQFPGSHIVFSNVPPIPSSQ